jgi:hypothetical protein
LISPIKDFLGIGSFRQAILSFSLFEKVLPSRCHHPDGRSARHILCRITDFSKVEKQELLKLMKEPSEILSWGFFQKLANKYVCQQS